MAAGESAPPVVAIVPARKGSKRVINKNMRPFHGRPLAAWTFDLIRDLALFDRVLVTTDDDDMSALVADYPGFEALRRPENLAGDSATVLEVMLQVGRDLHLPAETIVVLLQVTAPLRVPGDVTQALRLFEDGGRARTVVGVSPVLYPPALTWTIEDETLVSTTRETAPLVTRKQAHAPAYHWNDIVLVDSLAGLATPGRNLFGPAPIPLIAPPERGVAIDYPVQFTMAEALFPPHDERLAP